MKKTIIITIITVIIGFTAGGIIAISYFAPGMSSAMFMLQEVEIAMMEEAAVQAYSDEPNEVAVWALENHIKTLNRLKEERSSAEVEDPYVIISPDQSLVLTHTRLGLLYKKMNNQLKSTHHFEQAMSHIENARLRGIKNQDDLITLVNRMDQYNDANQSSND